METNAAWSIDRWLATPAALCCCLVLSLCMTSSASAWRPVGKDGKIHACYRMKGKPKGMLRVVRSARVRCRRGERKAAWRVAGPSGPGSQGSPGQHGQPGLSPLASDEGALKAQIDVLTRRVETLEGILSTTKALCEQTEALTQQVNLLAGVVGGLGLSPALEAIGLLEIPALPADLPPFACPTS